MSAPAIADGGEGGAAGDRSGSGLQSLDNEQAKNLKTNFSLKKYHLRAALYR
jgi:hypothetical protein